MTTAWIPVWMALRDEAEACLMRENGLSGLLDEAVLRHRDGRSGLAAWLARRVAGEARPVSWLAAILHEAFASESEILDHAAADLIAVRERDPACFELLQAFLFFKGFHALQVHRVAHAYWRRDQRYTALLLQHAVAEALAIDIHPATRIGKGVMLDHGTGFVAGETAVIEDNVSLLHGVTLGGTGKCWTDRHPKIRSGASVGAGAMILGNIEVGQGSRIGAGSVVLAPVHPFQTVVGHAARVVSTGTALAEPNRPAPTPTPNSRAEADISCQT